MKILIITLALLLTACIVYAAGLKPSNNDKLTAAYAKALLAQQNAATAQKNFQDAVTDYNKVMEEVRADEKLAQGTNFNVDLSKPAGQEVVIVPPPPKPVEKKEGK